MNRRCCDVNGIRGRSRRDRHTPRQLFGQSRHGIDLVQQGQSRDRRQSIGSGNGVARLAFDKDERGDKQVERCSAITPFPSHLLLRRPKQIATRPRS